MDRSHAGWRCRTVRHLNTVEGVLPRDSGGTIRCEVENFGRELVFVDWDNHMSVPVFPHEIEILAPKLAEQPAEQEHM